jgi:hypothetical protein
MQTTDIQKLNWEVMRVPSTMEHAGEGGVADGGWEQYKCQQTYIRKLKDSHRHKYAQTH